MRVLSKTIGLFLIIFSIAFVQAAPFQKGHRHGPHKKYHRGPHKVKYKKVVYYKAPKHHHKRYYHTAPRPYKRYMYKRYSPPRVVHYKRPVVIVNL